jgi:hypothetical protein
MSVNRAPVPGRCPRRVFYASPMITVTSRWVETPAGRYPVAELDDIVCELTSTFPGSTLAGVVGAVEISIAAPIVVTTGSMTITVAGIGAAVLAMAAVLIDARRNPRRMEIRAGHRGRDVALFRTHDRLEFDRVRWALIRAVELNRQPRP